MVELMIVIAIIGILASVAYPSYNSAVTKSNRADAIDSLLSLAGRMEELYMNTDSYSTATINAAGTGTVGSNQTSEGLYTLSISSATNFAYSLTATRIPAGADPDCPTLTLDSIGTKGPVGTTCW